MKITIDTKEDSKEDIRKVIRMLSSLAGEEIKANLDFFSSENKDDKEIAGNAFANMFGDEPKKETESETIDLSGFADLVGKSENKKKSFDDVPKVVSY